MDDRDRKKPMELISAEDYELLPAHPIDRFVAFEELCRTNLNAAITNETSQAFDRMLRLEYMMLVSTAAEECGAGDLQFPTNYEDPLDGLTNFMLAATAITTRQRLRRAGARDQHSVQLGVKTKARLGQQLDRLREAIKESNLSNAHKTRLLTKVDDLAAELSRERISFAKVFGILGFVGAAMVGGTGMLADAPEAIATITSLIGADKAAEEAEAERLGSPIRRPLPPPPRALPAPTQSPYGRDLDDEIPF